MLTENAISILSPFVGRLLGMPTKTIGDRIKEAREAKGWKQADLARELGVKPPTISQLESGSSGAPSADNLLKMRDKGFNPDYIMRGRGPKLIDSIEAKLKRDALMAMIDDLTEANKEHAEGIIKTLLRSQPDPSKSDPFKKDPPEGGTQ